MRVPAVDVGGTNVKILATGRKERRRFPSGPTPTPERVVAEVKKLAGDRKYDAVSVGCPGVVQRGLIFTEPHNLAEGWIGFDFETALGCPARVIDDATMQALEGHVGVVP